jgi:tetratricopeptide (TPR) repeat protein
VADRPNFFLLLELDPAVDDWRVIEPHIQERRRVWSKDRSQGSPKARRRAEVGLSLLPEIESVLRNPETRRQEAKEALRQRQQEERERLRDLDEAIAVLKTGGSSCGPEQIEKLVQRFAPTLSREDVRRRVEAAGLRVASEARAEKKPRPERETIDPGRARKIRESLEHLGLASLYEFLGVRPQSSPKALSDRADEIYKENMHAGRTDAETSARNDLAGFCKSLFQDDPQKARYDNTLAVEAMEALKPNIELAADDGALSRQEVDALIRLARQRGVSVEDARAFIEDLAATRKWFVQKDEGELPSEALEVCGFCSALAPTGARRCASCGEPLEMACPRCGSRNSTSHAACASCGCRTGDAPLVQSLVAEGERRAVEGDFAAALRCFEKALLYWPDWRPALEARQRAGEKRQAREEALGAVEALLKARKLAAARTAIERFARTHGAAGLEDLQRRTRDGWAKAESLFQEGEKRRRAGDGEGALDRYEEVLAVCADHEPALDAVAASPPPSPARLQATPLASGFRLTWQPAATARSLAYRLLRKAGGAPRHVDDGEIVGEGRSASLDDAGAPVGIPWYYAVFSLRGGVPSPEPAVSGPHLRTVEVDRLEALAGNGEVTLTWTPLQGCRRVEVWRKRGSPPERPGEGTALVVAGASARDVGLTNGEIYGYRVIAVFEDPARPDGEQRTVGRVVTATPVVPPPAVSDLRAARNGGSILLSWTPAGGACVEIRQTPNLPDYSPGLVLPSSQADRFGSLVAGASGGSAHVTLGGQGRLFFVPLSVAGGVAVAGRAVEVTALDPVAQLAARRSGPNLVLTWSWPPGIEECLVAWTYDHHPEDPVHGNGSRARITRREYDRAGCWVLSHAERRPHYLAVLARAPGADLYSPPARIVESMGQALSVSYQVVVKRALLRRTVTEAWIELACGAGDGLELPSLLIVGKGQGVPLSPRDGEILAEVPPVRLEKGHARLPIPERHWSARPYVKLFFKDAEAAREIRLLPAEKERLRLA